MSLIQHDEELLPAIDQQLPAAQFALGVSFDALPRVPLIRSTELRLDVAVIPAAAAINVQHLRFRMTADGNPIKIKSFGLSVPVLGSGTQLSLTLADPLMRSVVKAAGSFRLEISVVNLATGENVWTDLFADGVLKSSQLRIGWSAGAPANELSITTVAPLSDKLMKAPHSDLVIFDPLRTDVSQSDEPLKDTNGNSYPEELVKKTNLNLHDLFALAQSRCGFAGFKTNLPKYNLRLASFGQRDGFWNGVKPHIGQFDPLVFERDNFLHIYDSTLAFPAGFPSPRILTVQRFKTLDATESISNIDGFIASYSETDSDPSGANYYELREETDTEETGSWFDETYTKVTTKRTFRDYKDKSHSMVVTKSELWKEETKTADKTGEIISRTALERSFDFFGRETGSVKIIKNMVPDLPASTALVLKEVKKEKSSIKYAAHPINAGQTFIRQTVREISGLIAVDADNQYLEQDFEQDFVEAHRAGNLVETMTTREGGIKKITTTFRPQASGFVQTEIRTDDLIRKVTFRAESESKSGDIGSNSKTTKQRQLLVLERAGSVRGDGITPEVAMAELPSYLFIPLLRRKIARAKAGELELAVALTGVELAIRRGTLVDLRIKEGSVMISLGIFIVEGFSINGSALGSAEQKVDTSLNVRFVAPSAAPDPAEPDDPEVGILYDLAGSPVSSAALEITSGTSKTFQMQLLGGLGKKLIADAAPDLTIEGRLLAGSFVDLESTGLPLDAFDALMATIEVKITAAVSSTIYDRSVAIRVINQ